MSGMFKACACALSMRSRYAYPAKLSIIAAKPPLFVRQRFKKSRSDCGFAAHGAELPLVRYWSHRDQFNDGILPFGDHDFFTRASLLDKLRKMGFGVVDGVSFHRLTPSWPGIISQELYFLLFASTRTKRVVLYFHLKITKNGVVADKVPGHDRLGWH